jgi:hypothetical protein
VKVLKVLSICNKELASEVERHDIYDQPAVEGIAAEGFLVKSRSSCPRLRNCSWRTYAELVFSRGN